MGFQAMSLLEIYHCTALRININLSLDVAKILNF